MLNADCDCWCLTAAPPPLGSGQVHVWRFSLDRQPADLERLAATLRDDELPRAARFSLAELRHRFVAGRGLLRVILGRYLNMRPELLQFTYNSYGKPTLAGAAAEPGLEFNLSHSRGIGLLGLSQGRQIGVDVETVRESVRCEELAGRFFAPAEVADLMSLPGAERRLAFFRCWTRKESYIKALGRGLSVPLDGFRVSLLPSEPAALLAVDDDPGEPRRWQFQSLTPGVDHVAAFAVERPYTAMWLGTWPDDLAAL